MVLVKLSNDPPAQVVKNVTTFDQNFNLLHEKITFWKFSEKISKKPQDFTLRGRLTRSVERDCDFQVFLLLDRNILSLHSLF